MPARAAQPSTAKHDARLPPDLRAAFRALAEHNQRSSSEELRLAMHFWLIVAGVAAHRDRDLVEALEPVRDGRLHDFRLAAVNHVGDAFPCAAPEDVLESLARESETARAPDREASDA